MLLWASRVAGGVAVGVVSCSGAAVGVAAVVAVAVGVVAAGEPILWVSQLTAARGGRVGGCWV